MKRLSLVLAAGAIACGARSPLEVDTPVVRDAGTDTPVVVTVDAAHEDAASCVSIEATFRETTPTLVFIIDRSGSMSTMYIAPRGGYRGATRWGAVVEVLVGEGGILPGLQDRVRLGAVTFTSDETTCPSLRSVAPALHNAEAISALLHNTGPAGGTPITETMDAISAELPSFAVDGGSATLVLMTDGEAAGCGLDPTDPAQAVTRCFEQGARTYVIGLGDDVGAPYLQSMANAGGGVMPGQPDAEFWPAVQVDRFVTAINVISQRVADCRATLSSPIVLARACEAEVRLGDRLLPCNDENGWTAIDASTIELRGDACVTLVRDGTDHVTLEAPCDIRP